MADYPLLQMLYSYNKYAYIHIYIYMQNVSQRHNDKRTSEDFFRKICTSHFIARVRKGYSRFYGETELETEQNCNILTATLMSVSVVSFLFSRAAQLEARGLSFLLSAGFLYHILSPTGLQTPLGVPRAPSAGSGFPYHISSLTPTHQGPLRPSVAFPTTSCL